MKGIAYTAEIHAPDISPKIRHVRVLQVFDKLEPGEFMLLSNDHDPKPLYYQFMIEREDEYSWEYLEKGPDLWRVTIGKK